jgi:Fe2+ transport system protein B
MLLVITGKTSDMKKYYGLVFLLMTLFYTGCAAVEGIFKAGMWWGIFLVVVVIGLIFWIISKLFGRR